MVVVDPNSCFPGAQSVSLNQIADDLDQTLLIFEAPEGMEVEWMNPNDADLAQLSNINRNSTLSHGQTFHALFASGAVRELPKLAQPQLRREMATVTFRK